MTDERQEGRLGDAIAEAIADLRVADTIADLRTRVDGLLDELDSDPDHRDSGNRDPGNRDSDEGLDEVGRKVDSATAALAELGDLLEAQTERLETIEQRLEDGDPDEPESMDRELAACAEKLDAIERRLANSARRESAARSYTAPRSVLVVGKEASVRTQLCVALARSGYRVVQASGDDDAAGRARALGVEVAALGSAVDPAIAGAVCKELGLHPAFDGEAPVIVYREGDATADVEELGRSWGAAAAVSSPTDTRAVLAALARAATPLT